MLIFDTLADDLELLGFGDLAERADRFAAVARSRVANNLPQPLKLQANKEIPPDLYKEIKKVYSLANDVRRGSSLALHLLGEADPASGNIFLRWTKDAVLVHGLLAQLTATYNPSREQIARKAMVKATEQMEPLRDKLLDILREFGENSISAGERGAALFTADLGTRTMIRDLKRPRMKKKKRWLACVRPEWHRSERGKGMWRSKCLWKTGDGKTGIKLIYPGRSRTKRPAKVTIEGKSIRLVNEKQFQKLLEEEKGKKEKRRPELKPPKAKIEPGKKVDLAPKPKAPKAPVKRRRKPTKPPPKPTPKKRSVTVRNPGKVPEAQEQLDSHTAAQKVRKSWAQKTRNRLADAVSEHPAALQATGMAIGFAIGLKRGHPFDGMQKGRQVALVAGVTASIFSSDKLRILDHIGGDAIQDVIDDQVNDLLNPIVGVKAVDYLPTPLMVQRKLDPINSYISSGRSLKRAETLTKKLDPNNPPALEEIRKLQEMEASGDFEEVAALQLRVNEAPTGPARKKLQADLTQRERKIDRVKSRAAQKLGDWELERFDPYAHKKTMQSRKKRKRKLQLEIMNVERLIQTTKDKEQVASLNERKQDLANTLEELS